MFHGCPSFEACQSKGCLVGTHRGGGWSQRGFTVTEAGIPSQLSPVPVDVDELPEDWAAVCGGELRVTRTLEAPSNNCHARARRQADGAREDGTSRRPRFRLTLLSFLPRRDSSRNADTQTQQRPSSNTKLFSSIFF